MGNRTISINHIIFIYLHLIGRFPLVPLAKLFEIPRFERCPILRAFEMISDLLGQQQAQALGLRLLLRGEYAHVCITSFHVPSIHYETVYVNS